ncbi:MAG: thiolase family protein [Oligoflexales bacterium]
MTYILYAKRTPVGKMSGGLSQVPAPKLGSALVSDALSETKIDPKKVDEIIMGQVLSAGCGQAPARQAALHGGLSTQTQALTINRVCGSGLKSVMLADQAIRLGDADIIFAGGQENMSLAPHLLPQSRQGYRFGSFTALDHMQHDGLWDPYNDVPMGDCGETCADEYKFTREQQDAFAIESYRRAQHAAEQGFFKKEILPIEVQERKKTKTINQDEEPFGFDPEKLKSLRAAFRKDGSITAGNASSINDGAALLVLAKEASGHKPLAKIIAQASFAHAPEWFTTAPISCIKKVLEKANMKPEDIDLYEINEAFSCVTMAAIHDLKLDPEKVNIHGGAVSIGHPIGASGARILVTLIHALKQKGMKTGLATLCIGGGEASAVIIKICDES